MCLAIVVEQEHAPLPVGALAHEEFTIDIPLVVVVAVLTVDTGVTLWVDLPNDLASHDCSLLLLYLVYIHHVHNKAIHTVGTVAQILNLSLSDK